MPETPPIITQPINDVSVPENAADTTVNLFQNFDDPFTTGLIARFELFDTSLGGGVTKVLLFDQTGAGAPLTVQNFLNYVSGGDYVNSIIHRSVPSFIIQGGGFTVENLMAESVPTDPPVVNEFSANRSNLRGTIAMAKLGSNPNSATSQWFFNLANNSANLDNQNGGFTVFGQALSQADLAPVDAIASLPTFNGSTLFGQPAFTNLPVIVENPNNPVIEDDSNLVRYRSITISQTNELQFAVVSNSNPNLLSATINGGQLQLDYLPNQSGTAEIVIRATDLLGDSVEDKFLVKVGGAGGGVFIGTPGDDFLTGTSGNDTLDGQAGNDQLSGLAGNDLLLGGQNNDTLYGGKGDDTLYSGKGDDTLYSGKNNDMLRAGKGNDMLRAGKGNDILYGGDGNDLLYGGDGNDLLSADNGDDTLYGGNGVDILTGGSGQDRFAFNSPTEGIDTIADFTVVDDAIAVSAAGFGGGLVANAAIAAAQFTIGTAATTASHRFIYDSNNGGLFFDQDGTGALAAIQITGLDSGLAMTNADIFVMA